MQNIDINKFELMTTNSLALMIDIQEKLLPVIYNNQELLANCYKLINSLNFLEIPIITMEQSPEKLGRTNLKLLECIDQNNLYTKTLFSAITDKIRIDITKQQKNHIIIFGIEAHVCVLQTVRDLIKHGFYVHVISDCISSRTNLNKSNALLYMQNMGAVISNLETCLFDLMKDAKHNQFKNISKLIK